jgi:hypothetical protein
MRRREAGRGAAPAGLAQQGTRAASELPPGPLGVPARSWLMNAGKFGPPEESGAWCWKTLTLARREAPARFPQGPRVIGFALFGAPPPHEDEGKHSEAGRSPASRQGASMSSRSERTNSIPPPCGEVRRRSCDAGVGDGSHPTRRAQESAPPPIKGRDGVRGGRFEPVSEGDGWEKIAALPRLFPQFET